MMATLLTFGAHRYRLPRLSAFDQFACLDAITPIAASLRATARSGTVLLDRLSLITRTVETMGEDGIARLCHLCLSGVEREDGEAWRPVWDSEAADTPFNDLGTVHILSLVARIIMETLRPYLTRKPVEIARLGDKGPEFDPVELPDGLSWLTRPVERGMCRFESLKDGTLDLADIALMNDAIAVSAENESRARKAAKEEAR